MLSIYLSIYICIYVYILYIYIIYVIVYVLDQVRMGLVFLASESIKFLLPLTFLAV